MRFLRAVWDTFAAGRSAFGRGRVSRWAGTGATVVTTAVAVLLASFVAVALGLT